MPKYLFLDRDGMEVGIIQSESSDWEMGSVVERETGRYRVLEVIVPLINDVDGAVAYVIVEPTSSSQ